MVLVLAVPAAAGPTGRVLLVERSGVVQEALWVGVVTRPAAVPAGLDGLLVTCAGGSAGIPLVRLSVWEMRAVLEPGSDVAGRLVLRAGMSDGVRPGDVLVGAVVGDVPWGRCE